MRKVYNQAENFNTKGVNKSNAEKIFAQLCLSTKDYSVDNRGDVGSWVREAGMKALERWAILLCNSDDKELFTSTMCKQLLAAILKQAVEKIDKMRDVAGNIIQRLLLEPKILHIPQQLTDIVELKDPKTKS
jgi:hypothetical protein